jgi:DNA repair protein RecO (recombination protein O)
MLQKTRAIALHTIKYGDSGIIANVYTEQFGKQAYLIKNAFGKKSPIKANLFSPLNLLELEVYYKSTNDLLKLKEAFNSPAFQYIPSNPIKNTLSLFLAEILLKILREEIPNQSLFDFLFDSIHLLDTIEHIHSEFHLVFLMQILKFKGFFPHNNFSINRNVFDLLNGEFVSEIGLHGHIIPKELAQDFIKLIETGFDNIDKLHFTREKRQYFLEKIIEYYMLHISGMGQIKSLIVLKEIFS